MVQDGSPAPFCRAAFRSCLFSYISRSARRATSFTERSTCGLYVATPTATLTRAHRSPAAAEAVKSGKLGGLGLDAFEEEPLKQSPLVGLPRVIFTPHTGAHTAEAVAKMGMMSVQNAIAILKGEPCPYILK